ncbi:hypothetical protein GCM10010433_67470 [Streptomyces pulveraceus]
MSTAVGGNAVGCGMWNGRAPRRTFPPWWALRPPRSRVVLVAATENAASQQVAEERGFASEGTARPGGILSAGRTGSGCIPRRADLPAFPAERTTDNGWPAPNRRWKVIG